MLKKSENEDRGTKWIRRVARIWSLPVILYTFIFLAGTAWNLATIGRADPYAVDSYPIAEAIPPVLIFFSGIGLVIAWRWERLGGLLVIGFQLATIITLLFQRPLAGDATRSTIPYLVSVVVAIPGILFWVYWRRSKRRLSNLTDAESLA